jgi:integrase
VPRGKKYSVNEIKALNKPGRYCDVDGLYVYVTKSSKPAEEVEGQRLNKSWVFRFVSPTELSPKTGKKMIRDMGLKSFPEVTLAAAREQVTTLRAQVAAGIDPMKRRDEMEREKAKASKSLTFGQCAAKYIDSQKHGWTNPAHIAQWHSTFNQTKRGKLVFPALTADLNDLPVRTVDTNAVVESLEKIWTTKTETAKRVRGRIEAVLDWAKVRGYRSGDNAARWSGHLDKILAKPSKVKAVAHHPAMPWRDVPAFMLKLRSKQWPSYRALEFTILTATRTSAVIRARWPEIDFEQRLWTVQPGRVGSKITDGKLRTVPLSDRAIEILKVLPRYEDNPFVFVGGKDGRGLSEMAMLEVMKELAPDPDKKGKALYVPHGFRSTFKDWCTDQTNYPNRVSEVALWHVVKDKTEAAYNRTDVIEPRRLLMADWANYCARPPIEDGSNVTQMRKAKETA